jgi:hypothetical protein
MILGESLNALRFDANSGFSNAMPTLIIYDAGDNERRIVIERGLEIGREHGMDVTIDHPTVSRRHAIVRLQAGLTQIEDLGSANGSFLNGQRLLVPMPLHDGDDLRFGQVRAKFLAEPVVFTPVSLSPGMGTQALRPSDVLLGLTLQLIEDKSTNEHLLRMLLHSANGLLGPFETLCVLDTSGTVLALQGAAGFPEHSLKSLAGRAIAKGRTLHFGEHEAYSQLQRSSRSLIPGIFVTAIPFDVSENNWWCLLALSRDADFMKKTRSVLGFLSRLVHFAAKSLASTQEAKALNNDLALAARIQRRLLQTEPAKIPGYSLAIHYQPKMAVGGDIFEVAPNAAGNWFMLIGDVSGKGISAAMYAGMLCSVWREMLTDASSPADLLAALNKWLHPILEPGAFITMLAVLLEPATGQLRFAQAGHLAPVIRKNAGEVLSLDSDSGVALGSMLGVTFIESSAVLAMGDILLLSTDGLDEAHNATAALFGTARRDSILAQQTTATSAVKELAEAVHRFSGTTQLFDDLTLLAIQKLR